MPLSREDASDRPSLLSSSWRALRLRASLGPAQAALLKADRLVCFFTQLPTALLSLTGPSALKASGKIEGG